MEAQTTGPAVRESGVFTGICWIVAAWGIGFTLDLVARADDVTSSQWRYLMSVPGGRWSWVGVFLVGALVLTHGLAAQNYLLRTIGCGVLGFGCGAIAAFYVVAPFVDAGLTTLGYWPWLLGAAVLVFCAMVNAKPRAWF
ncbi:MAG: hypothetical protein JHC55_00730 [Mycolicibacterium sp.]|nr:hypothetical protein [Mycolicibacterium sp.]